VEGTANPTSSWWKLEIFKWLLDKGVPYEEIRDMTKAAHLQRAHAVPSEVVLQIEEAVKGTGHTVLWLLPYHAALYNPIEMVCLSQFL